MKFSRKLWWSYLWLTLAVGMVDGYCVYQTSGGAIWPLLGVLVLFLACIAVLWIERPWKRCKHCRGTGYWNLPGPHDDCICQQNPLRRFRFWFYRVTR